MIVGKRCVLASAASRRSSAIFREAADRPLGNRRFPEGDPPRRARIDHTRMGCTAVIIREVRILANSPFVLTKTKHVSTHG